MKKPRHSESDGREPTKYTDKNENTMHTTLYTFMICTYKRFPSPLA